MTSTTETAATNRYTLLRSTPAGETYAAGIAPDGTLVSITADLAHEDVEDILVGRANIAEFDFNEPTEGQVETWERDGWETGPRLVEFACGVRERSFALADMPSLADLVEADIYVTDFMGEDY